MVCLLDIKSKGKLTLGRLVDGRVLEAVQDDAQHISMRVEVGSDKLDPSKNLAIFSQSVDMDIILPRNPYDLACLET